MKTTTNFQSWYSTIQSNLSRRYKFNLFSSIKLFFGIREKLTYEERILWFVQNNYETGMEYNLDIEVMHHTQYLLKLAEEKKINLKKNNKTVVFHDPCELGRGSGVYEQPRKVLEMISHVKSMKNEKNISLCCGGSIGNTELDYYKRDEITKDVLEELENEKPDTLVTACPLCKKTLNKFSKTEIVDIAELVEVSMKTSKA